MTIPSCHPDRRHYARELCRTCYNTWYRKANPARIKIIQRREYQKNKARYMASSLAYYETNREAIIAKVAAWNFANPSRKRQAQLRRDYGLGSDDYRNFLVGQAGRCLVCLRVPKRDLDVDHAHRTGRVRGLICGLCNRGIGNLGDDPRRLRAAAAYVERSI